MSNQNENAMTTKDASQYLKRKGYPGTPKSMEVWRCKKRGPKYKKVGSRVFYEKNWLDEFMAGIEVKFFDPAAM
ncbi:MAG: hypothetical protein MUO63_09940 [Desulfobulbaceae bacterium]|nr:hypothetical protein [Desulfobulbaceae bacterium]